MAGFHQLLINAWHARSPWLWLLLPVEWLFRVAVWLRRRAYRLGILKSYRPPVPVVVVGNIGVGGSGKTPVVVALAQALSDAGTAVGIVSRGYGRSSTGLQIVSIDSDAEVVGDEPLLIVRRTGCRCAVSESRVIAVQALIMQYNVQIILSDDGLQHYALERDLEILVYDATQAFGNGRCLPVGPLREPLSRLREADIVLAKTTESSPESVVISSGRLVNLVTGECADSLAGARDLQIFAYAGIAHPESFFQTLRERGCNIIERRFRDHHRFSAADFADIGDNTVIMTEKDAVKCTAFATADMWYLQIDAELPDYVLDAVSALLN